MGAVDWTGQIGNDVKRGFSNCSLEPGPAVSTNWSLEPGRKEVFE